MNTLLKLTGACALALCSSTIFANIDNNPDLEIEQSVLSQINAYRLSHHLSALKINPTMSAQAKKHSQDMAIHRMPFGHNGFSKRIKIVASSLDNFRGGAENVAYNYKPSIVTQKWLESPGHKRNIDGHYNLTGIGIARDKQGKIYYTQLFALAK